MAEQGGLRQGHSRFRRGDRLGPQNANAYINRANAWRNKGDYDKAVADHSEAIRLDPQHAPTYESAAIPYFTKGEFSSAASDIARSQQLKSDPYAAVWLYLARTRSNGDGKAELTIEWHGLGREEMARPCGSAMSGQGRLRHSYLAGCRP